MVAPVDVVNIALQEIGSQASISSFNDGSAEAVAAGILYQPKIDALHRAAHWNCARYQVALTLLKAAAGTTENADGSGPVPPLPWLYEYAYPADCLKARFILPIWNANNPSGVPLTTAPPVTLALAWSSPPVPFQVSTDFDADGNVIRVILTDMCQAQLVYTKRIVNPDLWDPHFLSAATSYLGCWFVNALARNQQLFNDTAGVAKDIIAQARVSDGNEGLTSQNREASWIKARGQGFYAANANSIFSSWDTLAFPGAGGLF
jgi:hypothetical protein